MFKKAVIAVLIVANVSIAICLGVMLMRGGVTAPQSVAIDYKDFVSILLTALGVMIALGAFLVAVLAIWTYKNAMELITAAAEKAAREQVEFRLPDLVQDAVRFETTNVDNVDSDKIASVYSDEKA